MNADGSWVVQFLQLVVALSVTWEFQITESCPTCKCVVIQYGHQLLSYNRRQLLWRIQKVPHAAFFTLDHKWYIVYMLNTGNKRKSFGSPSTLPISDGGLLSLLYRTRQRMACKCPSDARIGPGRWLIWEKISGGRRGGLQILQLSSPHFFTQNEQCHC